MNMKESGAEQTVLITGAAGFIGFHLTMAMLREKGKAVQIVGIDNLNDYYDPALKRERLFLAEEEQKKQRKAGGSSSFLFIQADVADEKAVAQIFEDYKPSLVLHLAAQAGVRYSVDHPKEYIRTNIAGFFNILEACRSLREKGEPLHLVFASSSSVYGDNQKIPYSVDDKTDSPASLYAATKKSGELLARAYSRLYKIPATGLRFFTVYGPFGRPDMAYFKFTERMVKGIPITLYNYGDMRRDFTYVDDVVGCILKISGHPPKSENGCVPFRIFNIGNSHPEKLEDFVCLLEESLKRHGVIKKDTEREYLPMQPGDVYQTYADMSEYEKEFGAVSFTRLREGLDRFAGWYAEYQRQKRA